MYLGILSVPVMRIQGGRKHRWATGNTLQERRVVQVQKIAQDQ
jgi:hypothetical protein